MATLTITVDDEVLARACVRALRQGKSVNAILRDHLARYALMGDTQEAAVQHLIELANRATEDDLRRAKRRGRRSWQRADLHER